MLFCGLPAVGLFHERRLYPAISARKGTIVNRYLFALVLGLVAGGAAQAAVVDLTPHLQAQPRVASLASAPRIGVVAPPVAMSELPEPEVFAMMLVGLVLLGYRARRRDSSEKFK